MAAGNWTPELIDIAGGINLFGEAGRHSPWMTWEELAAADPDVIDRRPLRLRPRPHRRRDALAHRPPRLARTPRGPPTAGLPVADGNQYFNRPGPRVVETAEILAEILHGAGTRFQGAGWRPWI